MPSAKNKQKSRPPSAPSSNSVNATSDAVSTNRSSILLSSFAPSWTKQHLFASIIPGLKGQHLRVHDSIVGESIWNHDLDASATVLQWGYLDTHHEPSKKRRKTDALTNGDEGRKDVVLAVGLSNGDVQLYSPKEGTLVSTLGGAHSGKAIRDFKFDGRGSKGKAWSLGADARLVEWDLKTSKQLQSFDAPTPRSSFIHPSSSTSTIYIADHSINALNTSSLSAKPTNYPAFSEPVNGLVPNLTQSSQGFLVSAHTDRNIHVFSTETGKLSGSLLARDAVSQIEYSLDPETLYASTNEETQILTALNSKGELELFTSPFAFLSQEVDTSASLKAQRKGMTKRSVATISLELASSSTAILDSAISDEEVILAWAEAGSVVHFERVTWRDGNRVSISGEVTMQTTKKVVSADVERVNGVKDLGKTYVDENAAIVGRGDEIDDEDEDEDRMDVDGAEAVSEAEPANITNGIHSTSTELTTTQDQNEDDDAPSDTEPTFGDRLRELHPSSILVSSAPLLPSKSSKSSSTTLAQSNNTLTLTTLLTQALRSSDVSLLETVISQRSVPVITGTLSRLDPSLSLSLLQKITDRIAARPGRIGPLMTWTKHILVLHGAYIASRPDAVKKLRGLNALLKERSNSLGMLLALKGRLDMLDLMVTAHRTLVNKKRKGQELSTGEEGEREDVLYVEGQEESDNSEEEFVEEEEMQGERVVRAKRIVNGGDKEERDVEVEFESDDEGDDEDDDEEVEGEDEQEFSAKVNGVQASLVDDEAEEDDEDDDEEGGSESEGSLSASGSASESGSESDEEEESENGF